MQRMSLEEYRKLSERDGSKYHNRKTVVDGITFDSQAEARRYGELKLMEQAGEIQGFGRQPSFIIIDGGKHTRYIPDFIVCGRRQIWVEDVKGVLTKEFKLKQKLWCQCYPWLELRII